MTLGDAIDRDRAWKGTRYVRSPKCQGVRVTVRGSGQALTAGRGCGWKMAHAGLRPTPVFLDLSR